MPSAFEFRCNKLPYHSMAGSADTKQPGMQTILASLCMYSYMMFAGEGIAATKISKAPHTVACKN